VAHDLLAPGEILDQARWRRRAGQGLAA
jgi:hypothetical protein